MVKEAWQDQLHGSGSVQLERPASLYLRESPLHHNVSKKLFACGRLITLGLFNLVGST